MSSNNSSTKRQRKHIKDKNTNDSINHNKSVKRQKSNSKAKTDKLTAETIIKKETQENDNPFSKFFIKFPNDSNNNIDNENYHNIHKSNSDIQGNDNNYNDLNGKIDERTEFDNLIEEIDSNHKSNDKSNVSSKDFESNNSGSIFSNNTKINSSKSEEFNDILLVINSFPKNLTDPILNENIFDDYINDENGNSLSHNNNSDLSTLLSMDLHSWSNYGINLVNKNFSLIFQSVLKRNLLNLRFNLINKVITNYIESLSVLNENLVTKSYKIQNLGKEIVNELN
ncbi:Ecm11p ASCRUDRAFT_77034 [Ascoidea rubescens DSM 1968]|uniref:Extracellular mutant protein 11 C-terminal domain-containing protein n=1 Tax=Ascoidea rubescens DSM 1968 TaxID=1344418 RepID=A0A1D2VDZ0_9ASCO|nr:hypothetical protein ASCRUDRAFT_77034 [Ascoidea rubescens DSM 1968]ODV59687.1 hypothetical protein ASCRUDRAFT_77034 [Ascoidea rubescens DSM 1968]